MGIHINDALLLNASRRSQDVFSPGDRLAILSSQLVSIKISGNYPESFLPGDLIKKQHGHTCYDFPYPALGRRSRNSMADFGPRLSPLAIIVKTSGGSIDLDLPVVDQQRQLAGIGETDADCSFIDHSNQYDWFSSLNSAVDK